MTQRRIAAIPVVAVVLAVAVLVAVPPSALPRVLSVLNESVKVLGTIGLFIAALTFAPGDYLRRGWGLCALCYVFLLARDVTLAAFPPPETTALLAFRTACIVVGNASLVAGVWTLARAWSVAGLELPGSERTKRVAVGIAIAASVLFAGPAVIVDVMHGRAETVWMVASDVGDLLALPVIAPVAMIALAVSGGSLRWPWVLFTVSLGAWLLYDAVLTIPAALSMSDATFRPAAEICRVLAGTSALAAGLAQRRAVYEAGLED